jgi:class I fructose-bisphosphate aldolase
MLQTKQIQGLLGAELTLLEFSFPKISKEMITVPGKKFGKYDERIYTDLCSDDLIGLTRYQLMNQYSGRIPLINSGGASGNKDIADAVRTAVINKRAGGSGLILARKAFQKPFEQGVEITEAVQSVYLGEKILIA